MKIELCDDFFYRVDNVNLNIENEFNSCQENVLRNNINLKLYCGEWIKIKVNNFITHHVKPAQTLNSIAQIYGTDSKKIKDNNNLKNEKLFIGQRLKIYK